MVYLNPKQVTELVKQAEREDETISIRCIRKGKASKVGGPDKGDLYTLVCGQKPKDYVPAGTRDRKEEDRACEVLTVYATNRKGSDGRFGAWRRVNIAQVQEVTFREERYSVTRS